MDSNHRPTDYIPLRLSPPFPAKGAGRVRGLDYPFAMVSGLRPETVGGRRLVSTPFHRLHAAMCGRWTWLGIAIA